MRKKCLFVVEGEDKERNEVPAFAKGILSMVDNSFSVSVVGTSIHNLINKYDPEQYDSIVSYLVQNKQLLLDNGVKPSEAFSLIYLVFDFDPQDPLFDKKKLLAFASCFSDETRAGMLYLNYPMFESSIDVTSFDDGSFNKRTIRFSGLTSDSYRKTVKERTCLRHSRNKNIIYPIPEYFYRKIIQINEMKYRILCGMDEDEEWDKTDTIRLLNLELSFLEDKNPYVSVICSFVLLALDY